MSEHHCAASCLVRYDLCYTELVIQVLRSLWVKIKLEVHYQLDCGSSFSFFVVVTLLENLTISTNTSLRVMFHATLINSAQMFSLGNIFILSERNTNGLNLSA